MTLEEAIKALEARKQGSEEDWGTYGDNALQLGIEALKQLKLHREVHYKDAIFRLPGETEK